MAGRRSHRVPNGLAPVWGGLAGRQATLLPAEQNASCTDKPPFSTCLSRFVFVCARSLQSHIPACACADTHNSHSEQHRAYAEVMTTKQREGRLTYPHSLIRLALSLCGACDIHYKFRADKRLVLWRTERTERWRHLRPALLWAAEQFVTEGEAHKLKLGVGRLPVSPEDVWVYMCGHAHPHMLMQCMHVSPLSALNSVGRRYPEPSNTFTQAASAACFAYSWIYKLEVYATYTSRKHT